MKNVITLDTLQEKDKKIVGDLLVESYSQYQYIYEERKDWLEYAKDLVSSVNNPLVDRFLIAREGEEILGTLQLFTNSETAYNDLNLEILSPIIRMLAVSPAARGKGVAQALLKECINYARENGAEHIYLHSTDKMAAAIRLYEWLGFKRDRTKEFYKFNLLVKCFRLDI